MSKTRVAKLFKNGASQAVRLPMEFRFEGDEIYISRDEQTGDVLLSNHPHSKNWADFFSMMQSIEIPTDFMAERPMNQPPQDKNIFHAQDNL